jgi:ferrous iron transport protein A
MSSSLSNIQLGQAVTISSIEESFLKPKLMEMGLIKGKEITILFKAPLGDPIAIDVQGYVLSLRLDEAALIQVEEAQETAIFA